MKKIHLAILIIFEITWVSTGNIPYSGIVDNDQFFSHRDDIASLVKIANEEDPFARMEILGTDHANAPFVYDYNGLSAFASSVPANNFEILNKMMNTRSRRVNIYTYDHLTVIPDALFNVRYYISIGSRLDYSWINEIAEINDCVLYENPYHTSLGYMLDLEVSDIDFSRSKADILNKLVGIHTGRWDIVGYENVDMEAWDNVFPLIFDQLFVPESMHGGTVFGRINTMESGIFVTSIPYSKGWKIKVDGVLIKKFDEIERFVSFPLGPGEHYIEMKYTTPGFLSGCILSAFGVIIFLIYEHISWYNKS